MVFESTNNVRITEKDDILYFSHFIIFTLYYNFSNHLTKNG